MPEVHILTSLLLLIASMGPASRALGQDTRPLTVVLISMDTTRADALSCYGTPPGITRALAPVTPNLDALAAEGVRFEHFYSHAPTTLNSHSSMLTGRDPHEHGVPRNGYPLSADVPTLAEHLATQGFDTIGVIGASALAGDMGLSRGFRIWDDNVSLQLARQYEDRAGGVLSRTLEHLREVPDDRPLFLFVHFFDAHGPFDAPEPWHERFADSAFQGGQRKNLRPRALVKPLASGTARPQAVDYVVSRYLGEVSYVDHQIGTLLGVLQASGRLQRAIVAVTADHGEVMAEASPELAFTHGQDVTDGELHVPLILRGYGVDMAAQRVVSRQAGMERLAPTLARLAGAPWGDAPDLWDLVRPGPVFDLDGWPGRPTRTVFQEATLSLDGRESAGWNNLDYPRAVRAGGATLRAPRSGVAGVVESGAATLGPLLQGLLDLWDQAAPPHRADVMDATTRAALEALGYLGTEPGDGGDAREQVP